LFWLFGRFWHDEWMISRSGLFGGVYWMPRCRSFSRNTHMGTCAQLESENAGCSFGFGIRGDGDPSADSRCSYGRCCWRPYGFIEPLN
jgi:hypothetical protein